MKAAIYCRVSTIEQDIENQLGVLTSWAEGRGFEVVEAYREEETAWRAGHQQELARLVRAARGNRFRIVLVWSLDRLSRQGPLAIMTLIDRLSKHGVRVISYQESWTEAPGELYDILLAIAGWMARAESQRISERTKAGMERRRQELGGRLPVRGPDKRKRKRRSVSVPAWEGFQI
jgi:DNA invertase Pin-like site-specific DNA recombinase